VLDECRNRIRAMALIHELLYTAGEFTRIEFNTYLAEMVRMVVASCAESAGGVRLDLQGERLEVSLDTAVPLSLIASELVMNAVKHAFAGGRVGTLTIRLHPGGEFHELLVQDDGPGFPPDFGAGESRGVGMELIAGLTRQVRGEYEFLGGEGGARVIVRWPAHSPKNRSAEIERFAAILNR
jgi:two-component sensor histidine kinase